MIGTSGVLQPRLLLEKRFVFAAVNFAGEAKGEFFLAELFARARAADLARHAGDAVALLQGDVAPRLQQHPAGGNGA